MRICILDGDQILNQETLYQVLNRQLSPERPVHNLDALYDHLTENPDPLQVILCHRTSLEKALGPYAGRLLRVFADAGAELLEQ